MRRRPSPAPCTRDQYGSHAPGSVTTRSSAAVRRPRGCRRSPPTPPATRPATTMGSRTRTCPRPPGRARSGRVVPANSRRTTRVGAPSLSAESSATTARRLPSREAAASKPVAQLQPRVAEPGDRGGRRARTARTRCPRCRTETSRLSEQLRVADPRRPDEPFLARSSAGTVSVGAGHDRRDVALDRLVVGDPERRRARGARGWVSPSARPRRWTSPPGSRCTSAPGRRPAVHLAGGVGRGERPVVGRGRPLVAQPPLVSWRWPVPSGAMRHMSAAAAEHDLVRARRRARP